MKQLPALAASVLDSEPKGRLPGVGMAIPTSMLRQLLGLAARAANTAVKLAQCLVTWTSSVGEKTYFRLGIKEPPSPRAGEPY